MSRGNGVRAVCAPTGSAAQMNRNNTHTRVFMLDPPRCALTAVG
jgi:hypothetical protein